MKLDKSFVRYYGFAAAFTLGALLALSWIAYMVNR